MPVNLQQYAQAQKTIILPSSSISKKNSNWWEKDIQLFKKGLGSKQKENLYTELATLLGAGLDLQRTLQLIEESQTKKTHRSIIADIRERVIKGHSFSEALEKAGGFSIYETTSIRIGEESGQLAAVLTELSSFFAKTVKYRQQLVSALSYPVFVTGFSLVVVFFLLRYLVPMFSSVYERFDSELPIITQKIIALSEWAGTHSPHIILVILSLFVALVFFRKETWFRKASSVVLLRIPLFGSIIKDIYLSRFCQSMSLLLGARVSLLRAVELVKGMTAFYPLETSLTQVQLDVLHGHSLHGALGKHAFYPAQLISLLKVGEETGNIERMFANLAGQYNTNVDNRTAIIGSLLEPVLIIGLGILVGIVLIAMYLPLFQMSTSIG